jgi:hypothetical protein
MIRSLVAAAFGVFVIPGLSWGQTPSTSQTPATASGPIYVQPSGGQGEQANTGAVSSSSDGITAYDLGPAMAHASFAQAEYDRANTNLVLTLARARDEFQKSPDMVAARRDLETAQSSSDAAARAVLDNLARDSRYQTLLNQRADLDAQLHQFQSAGMRNELAARKMEIGAAITRMQSDALGNDNNVKAAKAKLIAAQQALNDKTAKFESDLYNSPQIVAARAALDSARVNRAAAEGYLNGAMVTRSDILTMDQLHHPYNGNIAADGAYSYPYSYPIFNPYLTGYYGLGGLVTFGSGNGFGNGGFLGGGHHRMDAR